MTVRRTMSLWGVTIMPQILYLQDLTTEQACLLEAVAAIVVDSPTSQTGIYLIRYCFVTISRLAAAHE